MIKRRGRERPTPIFEPGDLVLLSAKSYKTQVGYRKMAPKYSGPYPVKAKIHDNAYELSGLPPEVPSTQNIKFLKEFCPSPARFPHRPGPEFAKPLLTGDHYEWEVAEILRHREGVGGMQYLIKWVNYPRNSWLKLRQLKNCQHLLRDYQLKNGVPLSYWPPEEEEESSDDSGDEAAMPQL